jgi:hypothetical protein
MQDFDLHNIRLHHKRSFIYDFEEPKKKYDISRKNKLENMYLSILAESEENQVEKAFKSGTKLISDLLLDGEINSKTAHKVIEHFVGMYVEYKVEKTIHKYLGKHGDRLLINAVRDYLEDK